MPFPPAHGSRASRPQASQTIVGSVLAFLGVVLISTTGDAGWAGLAAGLGVTLTGLGLILHAIGRATADRTPP